MTFPLRCVIFAVVFVAAFSAIVTAQSASDNDDVMSVCPNGHRCMNGSNCTKTGAPDSNGLDGYDCDCQGLVGELCEFASEVYCVKGEGATSKIHFCVNQGVCAFSRPADDPSSIVPGCICPDNWEGWYCQRQKEQEPNSGGVDKNTPDEDGMDNPVKEVSANGDDDGVLSTGAIIGISIGAFVVTICLACIMKRIFSKDDDPPSVVVGEDDQEY